jgi:hypothetical protein
MVIIAAPTRDRAKQIADGMGHTQWTYSEDVNLNTLLNFHLVIDDDLRQRADLMLAVANSRIKGYSVIVEEARR